MEYEILIITLVLTLLSIWPTQLIKMLGRFISIAFLVYVVYEYKLDILNVILGNASISATIAVVIFILTLFI